MSNFFLEIVKPDDCLLWLFLHRTEDAFAEIRRKIFRTDPFSL